MSGWIKFWKDTDDDPQLAEAASLLRDRYLIAQRSPGGGNDLSTSDELRFLSNALRGCLVTLWCYADTHIGLDDTLPISSQTLDALVGIEGFCEVIPVKWVQKLDDGTIKLPGYVEKNELIAKEKRAADAKARQAAWRARNNAKGDASHNDSVTRNGSVTSRVSKCVRPRPRPTDLDQEKNKETEKKVAPERSRRVPEDFQPDLDYARTQCPDIDAPREAQKFRDWEFKTPRSDWAACWRTWIGNCRDSGKYAKAPANGGMMFGGKPVEWQ